MSEGERAAEAAAGFCMISRSLSFEDHGSESAFNKIAAGNRQRERREERDR